jgi:hypothetical protein
MESNFQSYLRNQHKKLPYNEIFEKIFTSSSSKNMGLYDANVPIFALNLKQLITPDSANIFSF